MACQLWICESVSDTLFLSSLPLLPPTPPDPFPLTEHNLPNAIQVLCSVLFRKGKFVSLGVPFSCSDFVCVCVVLSAHNYLPWNLLFWLLASLSQEKKQQLLNTAISVHFQSHKLPPLGFRCSYEGSGHSW